MFQTTNQTATINYPKLMRIPQGGAPFVQKDAASSCRAVDFLVPEIDPVLAGTTRNQLLATLTLKYSALMDSWQILDTLQDHLDS